MIGPAEIDEMMAEYADAIAASPAEVPTGTPVWSARSGEAGSDGAPYESFAGVPLPSSWPPGPTGR